MPLTKKPGHECDCASVCEFCGEDKSRKTDNGLDDWRRKWFRDKVNHQLQMRLDEMWADVVDGVCALLAVAGIR